MTSGTADADEVRRLSLSWTAPPDCPTGDVVRSRIDALLGAPVETRLIRPFEVRGVITTAQAGMELRLETNDNGLAGARTITGATCDELSSAGALVVALAVDPAAVAAHGGAPSAAFGESAPAPSASSVTPLPAAPLPIVPLSSAAPPPTTGVAPARSTEVRGIALARSVFDAGTVTAGLALGMELGIGFSLGRLQARLDAKYFPQRFSPAKDEPNKGADVSLAASSVSGCYVSRSGRLGVGGCVDVEAGVFLATGTGFLNKYATQNKWFAPGASVDLDVDLVDPLSLDIGLGALVPAKGPDVRYTPAGNENPEIFTPWPVVVRGGLGLRVALE